MVAAGYWQNVSTTCIPPSNCYYIKISFSNYTNRNLEVNTNWITYFTLSIGYLTHYRGTPTKIGMWPNGNDLYEIFISGTSPATVGQHQIFDFSNKEYSFNNGWVDTFIIKDNENIMLSNNFINLTNSQYVSAYVDCTNKKLILSMSNAFCR